MRSLRRKRSEDDEEESAFVPMTDMTVSFLFIVMILLAFFAVQFSDEDNVPRSVYEQVVEDRKNLIEDVRILKIEINKLKEFLEKLKLENSDLKDRNNDLTIENSRLKRELNKAFILISELEERIDLLVIEREGLELLNEKLDARIKELYDEIRDLIKEIDQKDELLQSMEDTLAFLKRIIKALYYQVSEKDKKISKLEEDLEELKARLKEDPLEAYLIESQLQRSEILSEIERKLKIEFPDILVEVSPENDALRFKGDGLFTSGSSQLSTTKRKIVEKVGILIADAIECFTINENEPDYRLCNPDGILIEAIQIEGHTDNSRFVVDGRDKNIELSAKRATSAFFAMKDAKPDLLTFKNLKGQPVISIAGYGDMRPVNLDSNMKAENRRIDLRLIMFSPTNRAQVNLIQTRIKSDLEILLEGAE